jgi:4,5-DOPA dioxygenase extradiol
LTGEGFDSRKAGLHEDALTGGLCERHIEAMTTQPALFLSHGAPDLALSDSPARAFLAGLGRRLDRPDAIVIASAHDEAPGPRVRSPAAFRTWHDFGGFDPRLREMRYEPPGASRLAAKVEASLRSAGFEARGDSDPRLDHGAWVPLSLLFPAADVPLVTVSIDPGRDSRWHERLGSALAPLRARNVLIVGSGSISHNLGEVFRPSGGDSGWVEAFTFWLAGAAERGDRAALLGALETAPEATRNHPTDEHFLPFFVALGAGGAGAAAVRLHHSYTYDVLAMDAYAFGEPEVVGRLTPALEKAG